MAFVGPLGDLPPNWSYGVMRDGRVFFVDEQRHITTWLHPITMQPFLTGNLYDPNLPAGWELNTDDAGNVYFIDHINCVNTYNPPLALDVPDASADNQNNANKTDFQRTSSKKKFGFIKTTEKPPMIQRDPTLAADLKGWLLKQDGNPMLKMLKQWKKRWCVLSGGSMFCYEDLDEHQLATSFSLRGCNIIERPKDAGSSQKFVFKVEQDEKKSYLFAADNESDLSRWISALTEASYQASRAPETNVFNNANQPPVSGSFQSQPQLNNPAASFAAVGGYESGSPSWQRPDIIRHDDDPLPAGLQNSVYPGAEPPRKPPRQLEQPTRYDYPSAQADAAAVQLRPSAGVSNEPARRSAYPYQPQTDQFARGQVPYNSTSSQRVPNSGAPPPQLTTGSYSDKRPQMPPTQQGQQPTVVAGNPNDLYAKVMKVGREPEAVGSAGVAYKPQYVADMSDPRLGQQQQQALQKRTPDDRLSGRDFNYNLTRSDSQWQGGGGGGNVADRQVAVGDVDAQRRLYRPAEPQAARYGAKHLDGTPMYGDGVERPVRMMTEPADMVARERPVGNAASTSAMQQYPPQQPQGLAGPDFSRQSTRYPVPQSSAMGQQPLQQRGAVENSSQRYYPGQPTPKDYVTTQRPSDAASLQPSFDGQRGSIDWIGSDVFIPSSVDQIPRIRNSQASLSDSTRRLGSVGQFQAHTSSGPKVDHPDFSGNFDGRTRNVYSDNRRAENPISRYMADGGNAARLEQNASLGTSVDELSDRTPSHSFRPVPRTTNRSAAGVAADYGRATDYPSEVEPYFAQPNAEPAVRSFDAIKEDPGMPDSEVLSSRTLDELKRHLSGHVRLRLSISTDGLIGKSHDDLVLLLIQLRRSQTKLEEMRAWLMQQIDAISQTQLRGQSRQEPPVSREYVMDLQKKCAELTKQIEITQPMISLLDNMVTMGSLYGANNALYSEQYKQAQPPADRSATVNQMIDFSRRHQEEQFASRQKQSQRQLTAEEANLEERLAKLYQLDRLVQEQGFNIRSLQEDKSSLEQRLDELQRCLSYEQDNVAKSRLYQSYRATEQELSRVRQQLAESSKLLEESTLENARVEQEVVALRNKVNGLPRSRSSPSLQATVGNPNQAVAQMERELDQVRTMMQGLSSQGNALSETIRSFKPASTSSSSVTQQSASAGTYLETDLDKWMTRDIAIRSRNSNPRDSGPQSNHLSRSQQPERIGQGIPEPLGSKNPRYQPPVTDGASKVPPSAGHYGPMKPTSSRPSGRVQAVKVHPQQVSKNDWSSQPTVAVANQNDRYRRSPPMPMTAVQPNLTQSYNVRRSVRDVRSRDAEQRNADTYLTDEPELRRSKSMPRVDASEQRYSGANTGISENSAVDRLFQRPLASSSRYVEPRSTDPSYQSNAPRQPVPYDRMNSQPNSTSSYARGTVDDRTDGQSDDADDRRGNFQRWRNMTVTSAQPVVMEARSVRTGGNYVPAQKSQSFDNLVKAEPSRAMEFDDDTIDRQLQTPGQVLIPERYDPLSDLPDHEPLTDEERLLRLEKAEKYKKMLAAHSLQEFKESELHGHDGSLHRQVSEEMKRREQLLDVRQRLAQEVTEKSKMAAIRRKSNPNLPEDLPWLTSADRNVRKADQSTPDIIGYLPAAS